MVEPKKDSIPLSSQDRVDLETSQLMGFYGISPNLDGALVFVSEDLMGYGCGSRYLLPACPCTRGRVCIGQSH
jgi:hypothetical protein